MRQFTIWVLATCLVASCATVPPQPQLTPLQLQALQQREFEATKTIAFQSVLSVFQDAGYTINSADLESGFITGSSATQGQVDWLFTGNTYSTQTRATATIEEGAQGLVRIRLNFVTGTNTSTGYGQQMQRDQPILDPIAYQTAFERIENAIFMRSGTMSGDGGAATAQANVPQPAQTTPVQRAAVEPPVQRTAAAPAALTPSPSPPSPGPVPVTLTSVTSVHPPVGAQERRTFSFYCRSSNQTLRITFDGTDNTAQVVRIRRPTLTLQLQSSEPNNFRYSREGRASIVGSLDEIEFQEGSAQPRTCTRGGS